MCGWSSIMRCLELWRRTIRRQDGPDVTGEANSELGFLRALWRAVGTSVSTGVIIDLEGLPPGIGGTAVCTPLLESLQKKQFLVWERVGAGLYLTDRNAPLSRFDID